MDVLFHYAPAPKGVINAIASDASGRVVGRIRRKYGAPETRLLDADNRLHCIIYEPDTEAAKAEAARIIREHPLVFTPKEIP